MGKVLQLRQLIGPGRLAFRLLRDHRVPLYAKLALAGAAVYALAPIDVIPDWVPVLGQLDDVAMLALGVTLFIKLCPAAIVEEHETALGMRSGEGR